MAHAAARARHHQQDPPLPGYVFIVFFARAGGLHLPAAAPVHLPRAPGVVRRVDDGAGDDHLGRRPGLDGERERLLALPAARALPRTRRSGPRPWAAAIPSILLELLGVLAYTVTTKTVGIAAARHPADVRQLVRGAVPDLRHLPAARDQHHRPVLLRSHAAGARRAGDALGRGPHRLGGLRGGDRHHLVPRELLQGLRRVPALHHRVAVRRGSASSSPTTCCAASGTTPRRWSARAGRAVLAQRRRALAGESSRSRPASWPP